MNHVLTIQADLKTFAANNGNCCQGIEGKKTAEHCSGPSNDRKKRICLDGFLIGTDVD